MILLDSNIIIYLRDPERSEKIAGLLGGERLATCNVVVAEVLGYKHLAASDCRYFEKLFATMPNYQFDAAVTKRVIDIRKLRAIHLPDAIIAATAVVHDLSLWTHNTADYVDIPGLQLFDPIDC